MAALRINCPLLTCAPAVSVTLCQTYCAFCKKSAGGADFGSTPRSANESSILAVASVDSDWFQLSHSPSAPCLPVKVIEEPSSFKDVNTSSVIKSDKSNSKPIPSVLNFSSPQKMSYISKLLFKGSFSLNNVFTYSKRYGLKSLKSIVSPEQSIICTSTSKTRINNNERINAIDLSASNLCNFLMLNSSVKPDVYTPLLCSVRKYSKKSDDGEKSDESDDQKYNSFENKNPTPSKFKQADKESLGEVEKDPELKALLKEIHEDFDKENQVKNQNSNFNAAKSQLMETETVKEKANVEDFSFYEVAEDIEDYDYKDEKDIQKEQIRPEKVLPISLERGRTGVFDLEEVIIFLDDLGAENIVSIIVPPDANFCDHMVVASAKSMRHMRAMHEELLWVHKRKKSKEDESLAISGVDDNAWSAMDMGNIVVHLFHGDAREYYNIESLWTLGPEFDTKSKDSLNKYELSAEDLFWMDAQQMETPADNASRKGDRNNAQKGSKPKDNH